MESTEFNNENEMYDIFEFIAMDMDKQPVIIELMEYLKNKGPLPTFIVKVAEKERIENSKIIVDYIGEELDCIFDGATDFSVGKVEVNLDHALDRTDQSILTAISSLLKQGKNVIDAKDVYELFYPSAYSTNTSLIKNSDSSDNLEYIFDRMQKLQKTFLTLKKEKSSVTFPLINGVTYKVGEHETYLSEDGVEIQRFLPKYGAVVYSQPHTSIISTFLKTEKTISAKLLQEESFLRTYSSKSPMALTNAKLYILTQIAKKRMHNQKVKEMQEEAQEAHTIFVSFKDIYGFYGENLSSPKMQKIRIKVAEYLKCLEKEHIIKGYEIIRFKRVLIGCRLTIG